MKIKMSIIIILFFLLVPFNLISRHRFFLQNRVGHLIKVDIASGVFPNYPKNKGPRTDEIPLEYNQKEFEEKILVNVNKETAAYLTSLYIKESGKYILKKETAESIIKIKEVYNIIIKYKISPTYQKTYPKNRFESFVLDKIENEEEKNFIKSIYILKDNRYYLDINLEHAERIRNILLQLNKDNEIYTGLDIHGTPSPHKFPRTFDPKTKANIDVHFAWGVKFDNIKSGDNQDIGYITFGFSINLTNFIMPSIEFLLKYNFILEDYPFEPYVGGVFYGGFLDGFPYGLSVIGGCDFFPMFGEDRIDKKNFYLTGELRVGAVLFAKIYYDTGINSEGIWKGLGFLTEIGFYFGYGYIFQNY